MAEAKGETRDKVAKAAGIGRTTMKKIREVCEAAEADGLGQRRIEDLSTLRRETAAWKRRINREGINIAWRFDRKAARKKFGYKRPVIRRSKN